MLLFWEKENQADNDVLAHVVGRDVMARHCPTDTQFHYLYQRDERSIRMRPTLWRKTKYLNVVSVDTWFPSKHRYPRLRDHVREVRMPPLQMLQHSYLELVFGSFDTDSQ